MSSEIAIRVEGLSKCYQIYDNPRNRLKQFVVPRAASLVGASSRNYFDEFWALRDISFEVRKGESVGILGRNGSGKSTLLQLITGTLSPTSGTIETKGRISALLELGAGFNPDFTGRENVYLNGALQGFTAKQVDEKFDEIASFADIGSFMDLPIKTYSSGMYARLAFSAAIHNAPEVLIVDEILAVGDSAFQHKCIKKLYGMMDDGVSILLVSHDAYQVRSICQKALLLKSGSQLFFGTSERAMDEYVASVGMPPVETAAAAAPTQTLEAADDHDQGSCEFSVAISNPVLSVKGVRNTDIVESLDPVDIEFDYRINGKYTDNLSFVVNLYREDGVYVFGTTTKMRGLPEFPPKRQGCVRVCFPSLPLVSGKYKWRIAVNDGGGLHILAEAVPVCAFQVNDQFRAVGLVDIDHSWSTEGIEG